MINMANRKIGKQSVIFDNKPYITGRGTVVGQKEGQGPLAKDFDIVLEEDMYGQKTWEKPTFSLFWEEWE